MGKQDRAILISLVPTSVKSDDFEIEYTVTAILDAKITSIFQGLFGTPISFMVFDVQRHKSPHGTGELLAGEFQGQRDCKKCNCIRPAMSMSQILEIRSFKA